MSINLEEYPATPSPFNNRRLSLDLLSHQQSKRRFSFSRRNIPSTFSLVNPNTVDSTNAALKTSSLLNGRPTSVAAALLGSWKEKNALGCIGEGEVYDLYKQLLGCGLTSYIL